MEEVATKPIGGLPYLPWEEISPVMAALDGHVLLYARLKHPADMPSSSVGAYTTFCLRQVRGAYFRVAAVQGTPNPVCG